MLKKYLVIFFIMIVLSLVWLAQAHEELSYRKEFKLTYTEKQWLQKHKVIKVGSDPSWPPFEFFTEGGDLKGISAEYLKIIAKRLDVDFENYKTENWSETLELAEQKKIDVVTLVVYTKERAKYLNFTKVYVDVPLVLISRKKTPPVLDLNSLKGKKIALVGSYIPSQNFIKDHPHYTYVYRETVNEALDEVALGNVDYVFANLATVSYYLNQKGYTNLKVAANTHYSYPLRMATRKDWPELVGILNKALDSITPEEKKKILDRWIYVESSKIIDYNLLKLMGAIFLFIILIFVVWISIVKKQKEEIKKSEEKFRSIVERLRENYIFYSKDIKGNINYISPSVTNSLGYEPHEFLNHYSTYMIDSPIDQQADNNAKLILSGEIIPPFELELLSKDGSVKIFEISELPVFDKAGKVLGAEGIAHDITDQKKKEKELILSEERFRSITSNIPEVVYRCLCDENWTMLFINNAIQDIAGYPPDDFIYNRIRSFNDIILEKDRNKVLNSITSAINNHEAYSMDYRIVTSDGNIKWVYEKGVGIYDEDNEIKYLDGFIIDMTHKREMEQALREQNNRLVETQKKLDRFLEELEIKNIQLIEANNHKSKFLSHMSHELRTPLNAIIGFSDVLSKKYFGDLNPKQEEYVNLVLDSSNHLLTLINDILDISKIDAGSAELNLEEFSFNDLVAEVSRLMESQLKLKEIEYKVLDNTEMIMITGDKLKYKQILINLLSNAIKYNKQNGSVSLSFARSNGRKMKVCIDDTGVGIPESLQDKIFEEFYQVKKGENELIHGTGIGLALTKKLVELHNGTIGVSCKLDEGCHFWFEVPIDGK